MKAFLLALICVGAFASEDKVGYAGLSQREHLYLVVRDLSVRYLGAVAHVHLEELGITTVGQFLSSFEAARRAIDLLKDEDLRAVELWLKVRGLDLPGKALFDVGLEGDAVEALMGVGVLFPEQLLRTPVAVLKRLQINRASFLQVLRARDGALLDAASQRHCDPHLIRY